MTKQELRKSFLQKRLALTDQEYSNNNIQIRERFFASIDLISIKVIHAFLPLLKNKEPNTWLIIDRLKKDFPSIKISIPKIDLNNTLVSYYLDDNSNLELNKLGIEEPVSGTLTNPTDIDLVIVPLLAYDKSGNRVGYGKGYYDRFLRTCRENSVKVGISFFDAVEKIDDTNEFDFRINQCINPNQSIPFSS